MATAEWAWKELNLDFPLESLLLVPLLVKRVALLEVLVELLRISHTSWKIQIDFSNIYSIQAAVCIKLYYYDRSYS